jgi:Group II intron, maturase-specific domain
VQDVNRFLRGWAGYFRYGNSARQFDKIGHYALDRIARFVAKRHKRSRGYGWKAVAYQSPNRLRPINLNGTIVAPRPNRPRRPGRRMPPAKNVEEPCAGQPHARCARGMTSSSGVQVPCGG